jgi:hypothetical protein
MRVFLVQTARGLFSSSGGYKANICLLRYLASQGHAVRQLCYFYHNEVEDYVRRMAQTGSGEIKVCRRVLQVRGDNIVSGVDVAVVQLIMEDGVEIIALEKEAFDVAFGGKERLLEEMARETALYIEVTVLFYRCVDFGLAKRSLANNDFEQNGRLSTRLSDFVTFLQNEIRAFSPSHIISNDGLSMQASSASELPGLDLCRIAVIHTAEQLPFGPFAGGIPGQTSSLREYGLLRQLDGIWSVSRAIKDYATKYGQLQTDFFVHHPWTYLEETSHELPVQMHNWDQKFIGMINPCAVKGSSILLDLVKACPHLNFLVYKSWGFNDILEREMKCLQNIT